MREDILEQLSSFMDGELADGNHRELVEACANDDGLRGKWARYHMIGNTLRSGLPERFPKGLPDRIAGVIDGEPAIVARPQRRVRFRPALAWAMAASVAGFAVFKLGDGSSGRSPHGAVPPDLAAKDAARMADEARRTLDEEVPYATVLWAGEPQDPPEHLTTYLLMHNQYDGSLSGPEVSPASSSPFFTTVVHDPSP